jgi:8-oxo-dGTP diphosphatase
MIQKIGLAYIGNGKLLLVRKKGLPELIMPGGKVHAGETDLQCLTREIREELGSAIQDAKYIGIFSDKAAGTNDTVTIKLYTGDLKGNIQPQSEIEEVFWIDSSFKGLISPIVKNKIIPFLKTRNKVK